MRLVHIITPEGLSGEVRYSALIFRDGCETAVHILPSHHSPKMLILIEQETESLKTLPLSRGMVFELHHLQSASFESSTEVRD